MPTLLGSMFPVRHFCQVCAEFRKTPAGRSVTSWRTPSGLWIDGRIESFPAVDAYRVMFEEVSASIRGEGGWLLPARDSVRVARAVDTLL